MCIKTPVEMNEKVISLYLYYRVNVCLVPAPSSLRHEYCLLISGFYHHTVTW